MPTSNASPNAARKVVFLYPSTSCRTITRRFAQVRPPFPDDVNDIVYVAPSPRELEVDTHTRPSAVTRGTEPFSPVPVVCWRICLGLDQVPCVPSRWASAYDTNTRRPSSLVPIAHDTYTRPKWRLRRFVSITIHGLSNSDEPLNGVRATRSGAPPRVAIQDAGVAAPRGRTATPTPDRVNSCGFTSGDPKKCSPSRR